MELIHFPHRKEGKSFTLETNPCSFSSYEKVLEEKHFCEIIKVV